MRRPLSFAATYAMLPTTCTARAGPGRAGPGRETQSTRLPTGMMGIDTSTTRGPVSPSTAVVPTMSTPLAFPGVSTTPNSEGNACFVTSSTRSPSAPFARYALLSSTRTLTHCNAGWLALPHPSSFRLMDRASSCPSPCSNTPGFGRLSEQAALTDRNY